MRFLQLMLIAVTMVAPAAAAPAPKIPRPAPEFVIYMANGGQQLLSQYRGKVVVLEFLFTTCPHCQDASRLMARLQKEYEAKGFQPLGAAFNPGAKDLVPGFIRDFNVTYPVGYTPREPIHDFLQVGPNESMHVPQIVFIDRKGMIRHQSLPKGDTQTATEGFMRGMIEKLLAEPAGTTSKTGAKPRKKAA